MNNFLILTLVLYGVTATPIAITNHNPRIIGGFDAYAGQFPYQVSIKIASVGLHVCGGSIISNQWILTSALCTTIPSRETRVVVGSIYLNSGGTTYKALYQVGHPDHDEEMFFVNDVGLIRVDGQIIYSDLVKPVKLTSSSGSTNLPFTISGWGVKSLEIPAISNTLQYVILKSISIDLCQEKFREIFTLYDTQICTYSTAGQAICIGDYGNPLVYNGEQHGIASYPVACGNIYPDIHTKVASFRNWIKEISGV